jgi:hypothetical protein
VGECLKETVYNLFVYVEKSLITELGLAAHALEGAEADKISTLQVLVGQDYKIAERHKVKAGVKWHTYEALMRLGRELELFEEVFRAHDAPINPLYVITPVVDEMPRILAVAGTGPLHLAALEGTPLAPPGKMVDYLEAYIKDGNFDIPQLLNDDYFEAIKLLLNAGHLVSAAKLLMSFVDTVAFVDVGDVSGAFSLWLNSYAELARLGITADELWEFRNGLLHMTNLYSRKVASGLIAPIILYSGKGPHPIPPSADGPRYVNVKELIETIAQGVSRWVESYNADPSKFIDFVNRYDLTISDSRGAVLRLGDSAT